MLPLASQAGKPADKRPGYSIGYTVHHTDLPGYFPNRVTSRAFVVRGDGSKPHQSTQFGGRWPALDKQCCAALANSLGRSGSIIRV